MFSHSTLLSPTSRASLLALQKKDEKERLCRNQVKSHCSPSSGLMSCFTNSSQKSITAHRLAVHVCNLRGQFMLINREKL